MKRKRMLSKAFDKQCKDRNRLKKAKWRLNKKRQQIATSSSSPTPTTVTTKLTLRRKEGGKRRRANTSRMQNEIEELRKTVDALTTENKKLKTTRSATPPRQSATSLFLDTISPAAKTRATNRLKDSKNDLSRGSQHDLRKELGINLSNSNVPKKKIPSPLHNRIEQFLNRDDISKPCSDKKKHVNDQQIRYRLNHLAVLHQQFEIETGIDIDYDTFCRHVPDNIKKPNNDSWGTCLCVTCLNPQMKFEKLQHLKSKHPQVKTVLDGYSYDLSETVKDDDRTEELKKELMKLYAEKFNVTYSEWQKKKLPNYAAPVSTKVTVTHTIQEFLKNFISEVDVSLFVHLSQEMCHLFCFSDIGQSYLQNSRTISCGKDV
jgi:hypothetical protein